MSCLTDITDGLAPLRLIYADNTTLFEIVSEPDVSAGRLNSDLNKSLQVADRSLVTMNSVNLAVLYLFLSVINRYSPFYFLTPMSSKKSSFS